MEKILCLDPETHQLYSYNTQTSQIQIKETSSNLLNKIEDQVSILEILKGFQTAGWEFRSKEAESYRRRSLRQYLMRPQAAPFPSLTTSRELSSTFADITDIQIRVDISDYINEDELSDPGQDEEQIYDDPNNVGLSFSKARRQVLDNVTLVTSAAEVTKQLYRKMRRFYHIILKPKSHLHRLCLKVKGRKDYLRGNFPMLSFKQVRLALRDSSHINLTLTEIPKDLSSNFPQFTENSEINININDSLFFWYPPTPLPRHTKFPPTVKPFLDQPRVLSLNKLQPATIRQNTMDDLHTGSDQNLHLFTGQIDWDFRLKICGLQGIYSLYYEGESAVKNGKQDTPFVTFFKEKDRDKSAKRSKSKSASSASYAGIRRCSVPFLKSRKSHGTYSRTGTSRPYGNSLANTPHINHGPNCRDTQDLMTQFKLPFAPYVISLEVMILYGNKILRDCHKILKYFPFQYFVRFYQWVNFPIKVSELPKESRVAINIYSISSRGDDLIIGSSCKSIFDQHGNLRTGLQAFTIWPFYKVAEQFPSMEQFWGRISQFGSVHRTATSQKHQKEFNKLEYCRIYLQFDSFITKEVTYSLKSYRKLFDTNKRISNIMRFSDSRVYKKRRNDTVTQFNLDQVSQQQDQKLILTRPEISEIASLERVLQIDPLKELEDQDKRLLFICRDHYKSLPLALQLFLASVDWSRPLQVNQAHRMLDIWSPLQPEDALALLNVDFPDQTVRLYATRRIAHCPDDDLVLYMPQLVFAITFESQHLSPLGELLIERSLKNPYVIGHQLFWSIRSQMHKKPICQRLGLILQQFLMLCGRYKQVLLNQLQVTRLYHYMGSIIVDKQKNERTGILRELIQQNKNDLPKEFTCPVDSSIQAAGLITNKCKAMDSKKVPLFIHLQNPQKKCESIPIMYKIGDDLRQDILTLQIIKVMDNIWLQNGLDLKMKVYKVVATGDQTGVVQIVQKSDTTADIQKEYGGTLLGALKDHTLHDYIKFHNRNDVNTALDNFIRSCAGYCVASYVIGIGDRHNGNIMIDQSGHIFHIDFGHFLGYFKKKLGVNRERSRFVFTEEMIYVMGGKGSDGFALFQDYCTRAYNLIRKHGKRLINLFRMMVYAGIHQLQSNADIDYLRQKLSLKMTEMEAKDKFEYEIEVALNNTFRRYDNLVHNLARK